MITDETLQLIFPMIHDEYRLACRNGYGAGFGNYLSGRVQRENERRKKWGMEMIDPMQAAAAIQDGAIRGLNFSPEAN